jgi:hypothetical protein
MPRIIHHILLVLFVSLAICSNGYAAINVTPSSASLVRGQASTATFLYQLSRASAFGTTTSTNGTFLLPDGTIIGTNPFSLIINQTAGSGTAAETVVMAPAMIEQVVKSGNTSFIYRRTFTNGDTTSVRVYITTDAAATFGIKRVELYFDNRRAEITVPKHFPHLTASADIRYTGSGILDGYWEVDGRLIARVNQLLLFGSSVTLRTPELPAMPTFDPGSHIVRFVVTTPVSSLPVPALVYFVTSEEFRPIPVTVGLISPKESASLSRTAAQFAWNSSNDATLFLIQYFENTSEKPLFSAYTRDPSYLLPELASKNIFTPGTTYYWKVTGYNDRDNVVVESGVWNFTIK